MGSSPFSRTSRQRQPGQAPARAGAQQVGAQKGRSPEHGLERGGVTTPQAGGSSISRSPQSTTQSPQPTTSQSRPPALHRIPDSPKQQQPLRRALARNDVARAASSQDEMVLSGSGSGAARRLRNTPAAAAPTLPFGPLAILQQQQPPVVVIPEGGGAKPPPPSMTDCDDGVRSRCKYIQVNSQQTWYDALLPVLVFKMHRGSFLSNTQGMKYLRPLQYLGNELYF